MASFITIDFINPNIVRKSCPRQDELQQKNIKIEELEKNLSVQYETDESCIGMDRRF